MANTRVGAGLSTDIEASRAVAEAANEAAAGLAGEMPNLVVAMISSDHKEFADEVAAMLGERFPGAAVIGCTTDGVIANGRELESGPAISLLCAFLPDTLVTPFGLRFFDAADGEHEYRGWPDNVSPDASLILLCDRFSFPAAHLLAELNETRPGTIVIGGIVSGGSSPGDTRLFFGDRFFDDGAVAIAISGRVRVKTMVSQGCRAVGKPLTITRADRNVIFEIAGQRPIDALRDIWTAADPRDRMLMQDGLQLGRVVDEYIDEPGHGDFLIRPVMGGDSESGVIAVGDVFEVGETVQFHVRDPAAADEDLRRCIDAIGDRPSGAVLFTCNGRGTNLFSEPDHDAAALQDGLGVPLVGMFCAGELGPVGGRNFMHGQTASVALFVDSAL
ncbi:MAG TPA: FIST N-terminal domain-containing protein [Actinomycetota bacterium]